MELLVGTRKGLVVLRGSDATAMEVAARKFEGDVVEYATRDPRSGRYFASVTSGFFGPKVFFTDDPLGEWHQADGPAFPEDTGAEVLGSPESIPEMVVPVGQTIRVKLVSADVVHSFYVPQSLFKRQAIPGTENEFDLTFEKTGLFHGQCTQFCGLQHPDMVFRVRVVTQGEYQSWLAEAARRGAAGQPGT